MEINKLDETVSNVTPLQLNGTCCVYNCLRDVCGGEYKGCGVSGWLDGDGDVSIDTGCTDPRFQSPC